MGLKRQRANEFIGNSIGKISKKEIINKLVTEHGYSRKYSDYLLLAYSRKDVPKKSLRESIEELEELEQQEYIKMQKQSMLDRPKIFINYGGR